MNILDTPITNFIKIAKVSERNIKRLGINNLQDLLFHFPFRYEDLSKFESIENLKIGQTATIKARIDLISSKRSPYKRMHITEALVSDGTGTLRVIWFNQNFITKVLNVGDVVFFSGQVNSDYIGLQLVNPSYEKLSSQRTEGKTLHTGRIVPIYPTTQGITSKQIRLIMKKALDFVKYNFEWLPDFLLKKYQLLNLNTAIKQIHFPLNQDLLNKALFRLKFDELFLIQIYTLSLRLNLQDRPTYNIVFKEKQTKQFVQSLGFKLTDAQRKSAWEILQNMSGQNFPMNRLLEGDVGSGKTVVAALAILNVFLNEYQSALIAPTEILAKQHFDSMVDFFKDSGMKIGLLTQNTILFCDTVCNDILVLKKKEILEKIAKKQIDLIIGTHSLLQKNIDFACLAFVVIDEQHRFGVKQRQFLKERTFEQKGLLPHFLSMTATPIPRSLALALYGDLDLSIIDQMPKGRKPVITKLICGPEREKAYDFIKKELKQGRQCFIICPLISPSDKLGVKSVEQEFENLKKNVFQDFTIAKLHGKLKKNEKTEIMEKFAKGEIQILISTSVVEVGINVPNATVMIIEGAERFGLAQLHQFRGRVGRSDFQSYCFLFTDTDQQDSLERLEIFTKTKNGFELAQQDLKLRGPGEVYGYKQSGTANLKLADLTDVKLIKLTRSAAKHILSISKDLEKFPKIKQKLEQIMPDLIDLE